MPSELKVMRPLANDGIVHRLFPPDDAFPPAAVFAEIWRRYMLAAPRRFSMKDIEDLDG
jgi:hypothetical protein